mmetsp:Transcript_6457/g.7450  ORF Transcript_6457/g.7450 Transcript_6457/m.7450 type:complete len:356 (+) Transcript_6457:143-1210(+)
MAKTKYSRSTWNKNTLSANLNTPRTGSKGCSLCADRSIPANLNTHVSDSQTCADIHLQLAMLRYDNAMCATGQEQYQELCCTIESAGGFKTAVAFMIGALVTGFILRKVVSSKSRRIEQEQEDDGKCDDDVPGTVSINSRSSHGISHVSRTSEIEMPSSYYHQMKDPETSFKSNRPHSSRSRNRPTSRSRPRDIRDSRPISRTRDKSRPRDIRNNRPVSRTRDRSCPRDIMSDHHSRDRSQSRGRKQRPQNRSHPRDVVLEHNSRNSPRDRSRSRGRNQSHGRSRGGGVGGTGRSQSRTKGRSQLHDVETGIYGNDSDDAIMVLERRSRDSPRDLSRSRGTNDSDDAIMLPTQVL